MWALLIFIIIELLNLFLDRQAFAKTKEVAKVEASHTGRFLISRLSANIGSGVVDRGKKAVYAVSK